MGMRVTALGELLVDFASLPAAAGEERHYAAHAGGAPVNVLVQLAKLGVKTSFIGKVGDDGLGRMLGQELGRQGVGAEGLLYTTEAGTTLAFVTNEANGERSFRFYRSPGADQLLRPEDVQAEAIRGAQLFHIGSVSLSHEPARSATLHAVRLAKEAGVAVSFDPNIRPALWSGGTEEALTAIRGLLPEADILKVSEEELALLTGDAHVESGAERLATLGGAKVLLVTLGAEGCYFRTPAASGFVAGFPARAVDTTGAGDAFCGAALFGLLSGGEALGGQTEARMHDIVRFANAAGSLTTTRKGAIPAIPSREAIEALLNSGNS